MDGDKKNNKVNVQKKKKVSSINSIVKLENKKEAKKPRIYKEPNKSETETTVNVLYWEEMISIYTNKVDLQKQLRKTIGKPSQEYIRGRSIVGARWNVPFSDKQKISQMILKVNLFEL